MLQRSAAPLLIQILLEANEHLSDLTSWPQVGCGVGNCVFVPQKQERRELVVIEFIDALGYILAATLR